MGRDASRSVGWAGGRVPDRVLGGLGCAFRVGEVGAGGLDFGNSHVTPHLATGSFCGLGKLLLILGGGICRVNCNSVERARMGVTIAELNTYIDSFDVARCLAQSGKRLTHTKGDYEIMVPQELEDSLMEHLPPTLLGDLIK